MSTLSEKDREELSLLLPWYANGTLEEDESRKVEEALANDEALAREFDLVLEDQASVVELVSEEVVPSSMAERFKVALTVEQESADTGVTRRQSISGESMFSRIASVLFPTRPVAYAAVAAAIVVCVQAAVIFSVVTDNQQTSQYQTASGEEDTAVAKTRMLVKFKPEVSLRQIDGFLKEHKGQIIKGPTADGFYELAFEKTEKTEKLAEEISAEAEIFEFALPVN